MSVNSKAERLGEKPSERLSANRFVLLGILAATFLAYARTLGFEFVYDDFVFLVNNPAVHSWHYLPQYFTASVWEGIYPGVPGNYYRPVFLLWVRLQDALFGNQSGLWHLTTVATHLVATALAYYLALRLLKDRFGAAVAAMIFGLHPIHIEAVAWVSGVTEPLVGVFFIGAFLCYLKMRDGGNKARLWLAAALTLYVVGLLEKETEILLPALICAYGWLYTDSDDQGNTLPAWRDRFLSALRDAGPFILITVPYLIARIVFLKGFSHPATRLSLSEIILTWPLLVWFWIKHLVAPVGLGTFYDLRTVEHPGWGNFVIPLAGTAVAVGFLVWGARRSRAIAFSAAWMIFPLLPFFDLRMFNHNNFAQDRFLYLPSLGLAVIVGVVFGRIPTDRSKPWGFGLSQAISIFALAALLGFGVWQQCFYFENNWIFFRYNYLLAPRNALAENGYGEILVRMGMPDEAIKVLEQATADEPTYHPAAYNLGCLYFEEGDLELAQQFLLRAIQLNPTLPNQFVCLGMTELKARHLGEAESAFREALRIDPQGKENHYHLGLALEAQGDSQEALEQYQAELAVNPTHPYARQRANALEALRRKSANYR